MHYLLLVLFIFNNSLSITIQQPSRTFFYAYNSARILVGIAGIFPARYFFNKGIPYHYQRIVAENIGAYQLAGKYRDYHFFYMMCYSFFCIVGILLIGDGILQIYHGPIIVKTIKFASPTFSMHAPTVQHLLRNYTLHKNLHVPEHRHLLSSSMVVHNDALPAHRCQIGPHRQQHHVHAYHPW